MNLLCLSTFVESAFSPIIRKLFFFFYKKLDYLLNLIIIIFILLLTSKSYGLVVNVSQPWLDLDCCIP